MQAGMTYHQSSSLLLPTFFRLLGSSRVELGRTHFIPNKQKNRTRAIDLQLSYSVGEVLITFTFVFT